MRFSALRCATRSGFAATESLGGEMKVLGLSGLVLIVTSRFPLKVLEAFLAADAAGRTLI